MEREREKGLWFNWVGWWWCGRVSEKLLKDKKEDVKAAHKTLEVLVKEVGMAWQVISAGQED